MQASVCLVSASKKVICFPGERFKCIIVRTFVKIFSLNICIFKQKSKIHCNQSSLILFNKIIIFLLLLLKFQSTQIKILDSSSTFRVCTVVHLHTHMYTHVFQSCHLKQNKDIEHIMSVFSKISNKIIDKWPLGDSLLYFRWWLFTTCYFRFR